MLRLDHIGKLVGSVIDPDDDECSNRKLKGGSGAGRSGDLVVLLLGGFACDCESDDDDDGDGDDDDDEDEAPVCVDLPPEVPQVLLGPTYPDCYLLRVVSVSFISS